VLPVAPPPEPPLLAASKAGAFDPPPPPPPPKAVRFNALEFDPVEPALVAIAPPEPTTTEYVVPGVNVKDEFKHPPAPPPPPPPLPPCPPAPPPATIRY